MAASPPRDTLRTDAPRLRERGTGLPWLLLLLAVLVAVPTGLTGVLLRSGVHFLFEALQPFRDQLWAVLLPAIGALLSIWIVRGLFREPSGHAVGSVLESVLQEGGSMHPRSIFSWISGALVSVASGGSAGLEGPIVTSGAAAGSTVGGLFRLPERQRVLLVACGVAGGVAAVFNAPLFGLVFAVEVVLAEWSFAALLPIALSSTLATEVARVLLGNQGAFQHPAASYATVDLLLCLPLGALAGVLAVALVRGIRLVHRQSIRLRSVPVLGKPWYRAALGGLGVGIIGMALPGAIGEGYSTVARLLAGGLDAGLTLLALLILGKLLATCLTLGSGAVGGIFAASLVLGALLGFSLGEAARLLFPAAGFSPPETFALVAMAGLVAGTLHAPLSGIFLVLETTSSWGLTLPLVLVAVFSVLAARLFEPYSYYTRELARAGALLRPGTDRRILSDIRAAEVLDAETASIEAGRTLDDLARLVGATTRNHFAVVEPGTRRLLGMLDFSALRPFIFDEVLRQATPVDTVMDTAVPVVHADDPLLQAMDLFERSGAWVLPVVRDGVFLGTLSKSTLFDRYRQELILQTAVRQ
ncbi:MAG: chloride channel protein [Planctomycetota bacterium]|nr:MAG: chloride channel protein [Planctomycetota bacterium]